MPGASDPEYTRAREVLLDALDALRGQLDAVVLVGAQAVYLHTGEGDLAVAPTTTDADIALAPDDLLAGLPVADAMAAGGFVLTDHVGSWRGRYGVVIDLMVPDALSGAGSRAARIPPHGDRTARKAVGLEAALVDRSRRTVRALEPTDTRATEIWVAGPTALLVAKLHKIAERVTRRARSPANGSLRPRPSSKPRRPDVDWNDKQGTPRPVPAERSGRANPTA